MREKLAGWKVELERYGTLGLYTFLATSLVAWIFFLVVLTSGTQESIPWLRDHPDLAKGALLPAAWLLVKATMVPRLLFSLAILPLVARWTGWTPR